MISNPQIRGGNFLTDTEAVAFTGVADVNALITAFNTYANPNAQPLTFPVNQTAVRHWPLHALCTVYVIDHNAGQARLIDLVRTGAVASTPFSNPVVSYSQ
jgi:hypothetical protein